MQDRTVRNLMIEHALRTATHNNEVYMVYQPQISLVDNSIIGAESLIRWNNPELGSVPPSEFIPIAEKSGQIIKLGEWIFENVAKQVSVWQKDTLLQVPVSINISAIQFKQQTLSAVIFDIFNRTHVNPSQLEMELTETAAMDSQVDTVGLLEKLYNNGIRLSLDDFGTGYSSLSILKKFKIYKIKIDQSFIRDITHDPDDRAIVAAIIEMSHALGFNTLAEGVETLEQLNLLKGLGCDEAQGYYISRPLTADKFIEFVHNYTA